MTNSSFNTIWLECPECGTKHKFRDIVKRYWYPNKEQVCPTCANESDLSSWNWFRMKNNDWVEVPFEDPIKDDLSKIIRWLKDED